MAPIAKDPAIAYPTAPEAVAMSTPRGDAPTVTPVIRILQIRKMNNNRFGHNLRASNVVGKDNNPEDVCFVFGAPNSSFPGPSSFSELGISFPLLPHGRRINIKCTCQSIRR